MATFKIEIQNKRADGTYNLRIRVTHNTVVRRISTNLYVTGEELTRSKKLKEGKTALLAEDLIKKCRETCNSMGMEIQNMSIDTLVDRLKSALKGGETFRLDFIKFAEEKILNLSSGTAMIYRTAINTLRRFIMRDELDISEINVSFLRAFERFIEAEPSKRGSNRKAMTEKAKEGKGGQRRPRRLFVHVVYPLSLQSG